MVHDLSDTGVSIPMGSKLRQEKKITKVVGDDIDNSFPGDLDLLEVSLNLYVHKG